jgi:hypothetical protein
MTFVPWSPAEDEQLRKLALSGLSLLEIAARMERTKSSVRAREDEHCNSPRSKPDAKDSEADRRFAGIGLKAKGK